MFAKHVTCHKASGYRGLRPVMLYGYMFCGIHKNQLPTEGHSVTD